MSIKSCLILSAGLGTRMGAVGQLLPKVLWPVFSQTLLELQVKFAKSLGIEKVYANIHYKYEEVVDFLSSKNDLKIELLHEPELLDIGGAIHNLKQKLDDSLEHVLILNCDQFFMLDQQELIKQYLRMIDDDLDVVLFPVTVKADSGYNQLCTDKDNNILSQIIPYGSQQNDYITYSGVSIINLKKIKYQSGVSKFFQTVANPALYKVVVASKQCGIEYWDFGTSKRYYESIFQIVRDAKVKNDSLFGKFLKRSNVFVDQYFNDNVLCFNKCRYSNPRDLKSIILSSDEIVDIDKEGIYYNRYCSEV